MSPEVSAPVHQVLNDVGVSEVSSTHQHGNTEIIGRIHVGSEFYQQFNNLQSFGVRFSIAIAFDPRVSCGCHERCLVEVGYNVRISAVRQQESNQFQVGGISRPRQCCSERDP